MNDKLNVIVLFAGQGSQYVGMGKDLYNQYKVAKDTFEEANEILGFDLARLCFEGDERELCKTENAQVAILTQSIAMFRTLEKEFGIKPVMSAGHSLGEFSALTAANVITYSDALKIVRKRGELMSQVTNAVESGMSAIRGCAVEDIEEACRTVSKELNVIVGISNYNSYKQNVISGEIKGIEAVEEKLALKGGVAKRLNVSGAFHSPLMEATAEQFSQVLEQYKFHTPQWPVISNVTALPFDVNNTIELLRMQMVNPVQWVKMIEYTKRIENSAYIEIGPKTVLKRLVKNIAPKATILAGDNNDDMDKIRSYFTAEEKKEDNCHTIVTKCLAIAVCTKNNNENNDEYEEGVSRPYKKIRKMQEEIEKTNSMPTQAQIEEALEMLHQVFVTKETPVEEQKLRYEQIITSCSKENEALVNKYLGY